MISSRSVVTGLQRTQLNDPEGETFQEPELIDALNQALRTLTLLRPDATAKYATVNIQRGARQIIPADGVRLIRVISNIRESGQRGQIPRLVQKEDMDSMSHDWMQAAGTHVKEYMFDARVPKQFFIYPTVSSNLKLEIEYSAHPKLVTPDNFDEALPVDDMYSQPIQELMLYILLSGDSTNGSSGTEHLTIATQLLGVQDLNDERLSPARKTSN